jgi:tRNA(Ile2) C34 agmatinyltransferase TiaS
MSEETFTSKPKSVLHHNFVEIDDRKISIKCLVFNDLSQFQQNHRKITIPLQQIFISFKENIRVKIIKISLGNRFTLMSQSIADDGR